MIGEEARCKLLKVYVTEAEREQILQLAALTRLSTSAYLRRLGLGYTPLSTLDHQAVLALAKAAADQGRLGGLLKLWLSGRPGAGAPTTDVRRLLHQIEAAQEELRSLMRRL